MEESIERSKGTVETWRDILEKPPRPPKELKPHPDKVYWVKVGNEEEILKYLPHAEFIYLYRTPKRILFYPGVDYDTYIEIFVTINGERMKILYRNRSPREVSYDILSERKIKWRDIPQHVLEAVKKRIEELGPERTLVADYVMYLPTPD